MSGVSEDDEEVKELDGASELCSAGTGSAAVVFVSSSSPFSDLWKVLKEKTLLFSTIYE